MNYPLKPIHEQVVVVMGASSGIGRLTALKFARHGAKVLVSARGQEGLDSLVEQITGFGGEAHAQVADTMHFDQVQQVAEEAVRRFGRIDTWVHTAAVSLYATVEQTQPEEYKQVIDVNLLGQIYGAKAALPHLRREGRGALIHISSVEAKVSLPYQSAYAASKHGIAGFLDTLRLELAHDQVPISVTNILPASINTPFFNKALTRLGVQPKGAPPIYEPEQVADAILYAAEHPVRDYVVGGAGKVLVVGQALSPKLMDTFLLANGFESQRSSLPKGEEAPNNLFGPIEGFNRIWGNQKDPQIAGTQPPSLWQQLKPQQLWATQQAGTNPRRGYDQRQPATEGQSYNQGYQHPANHSYRRLGQRLTASSGITLALAGLALGAVGAIVHQSMRNGQGHARPQNLRNGDYGSPASMDYGSQHYGATVGLAGQQALEPDRQAFERQFVDETELPFDDQATDDTYLVEETVILEVMPDWAEEQPETQLA